MRATPQSSFRQPLDEVLGTVSCVRVLRELVLHGQPLTASELAERTALSRPSVGEALDRLMGLGLVEPVGTARSTPYRVRDAHFLAEPLGRLFREEAERRQAVAENLRAIARRADPAPDAVWIYGSVARGEDRPDSDLDVVVVAARPEHRASLEAHFRDALLELEDRWDLPSTSVVVLTAEEVRNGVEAGESFYLDLREDAVPVFGSFRAEVFSRG